MHAIVLGGTGLIGSAVSERLAALGHRVTVMTRKAPSAPPAGCTWQGGDIVDAAPLRAAFETLRPDAVLHLAAFLQYACEQDPAQAVRVNVDGTLNVLEACRATGVRRLVFASSIAAYGERVDLMREDDPPTARIGLYGMTKSLGEMLGDRYANLHGLEFVALRYAGVFGPAEVHSPGMAMVRQRIKETAQGRDVVVEGASGDERSHATHAIDAAEATCRALLHPKPAHRVYNVGGPPRNHVTLKAFHDAVRAVAPSAGKAIWQGRGKDSGPVDLARLRDDLGYVPTIGIEEGLRLDFDSKPR